MKLISKKFFIGEKALCARLVLCLYAPNIVRGFVRGFLAFKESYVGKAKSLYAFNPLFDAQRKLYG